MPPSAQAPDLERLLLATARAVGSNARLFPLVVTWLSEYGNFVARHRLKRLVGTELAPESRPALGLILEAAVHHGASKDLLLAVEACRPAAPARPLFDIQREAGLRAVAERTASSLSRRWGLWAPETQLRLDAIRPVGWLLQHNPEYRARIIRKGDLRCSIIESLRHDSPRGVARSESELARLAGANRSAVRKALAALVQEGELALPDDGPNRRDHPVRLLSAA